ncbi:DUF4865 family protein [Staphylococcus aureus]
MQYHVKLPSDYNMEIIRDRVRFLFIKGGMLNACNAISC